MMNALNFTWLPGYNFGMKRWIYTLAIVCLVMVWGVTAVSATTSLQTENLTSRADVTYGKEILFELTGPFTETVAQVDLFFTIGSAPSPYTVKANFAQDEAGVVTASYLLKRESAELPPFAEVRYWWVIRTADSQTYQLPEAITTYRDDRFEWRSLTDHDVTIYWTGSDAGLGQTALEIVQESRETLDAILPPGNVSPLNVYIYPSTGDLRAGLRLAGRDVVDGHTDPALGVLLVTAVNPITAATELHQSIPHALTHLRLYQLGPTVELPYWYAEGIALLASAPDEAMADLVATAVADQETLPLLQLCTNFPDEPDQAELALAQSVSLLRTIQTQFGDQALRQLGSLYLAGASCKAGLTQTLDMSLVDINVAWLDAQAPQPAWLTFLTENGLWLLLVAGSFGLLVLILRR
ncbi:MAG: hypothetical protein KC434_06290 [Anaerolineales bacterium]|nr:hypothetical protein [Anaerolineales bacterium]